MSSPLAINAGELRHTIQIQIPSSAQDSFGQPTKAWNTVLTTRVKVETMRLHEQWATSEFSGQATHRITLRYPAAVQIRSGMQVLFGTKVYRIQSIENVLERNRVLLLLCLETEPTS